jgi:hypothetical protein
MSTWRYARHGPRPTCTPHHVPDSTCRSQGARAKPVGWRTQTLTTALTPVGVRRGKSRSQLVAFLLSDKPAQASSRSQAGCRAHHFQRPTAYRLSRSSFCTCCGRVDMCLTRAVMFSTSLPLPHAPVVPPSAVLHPATAQPMLCRSVRNTIHSVSYRMIPWLHMRISCEPRSKMSCNATSFSNSAYADPDQ